MKNPLKNAVKLLYPDRCLFCDSVVAAGHFCCARCQPRLPTILDDCCICCGKPPARCGCSPVAAKPYRWLIAVFRYTGPVRRAVATFKFGGRREAADYFAGLMAERLLRRASPLPFEVVTCVPMSRQKEQRRGYNQSALLAAALALRLGLPFEPGLLTRSGILTQHDLSGRFRRLGAKAAFHAGEAQKAQGRHILLVDDIATTGSTLEQCAWALMDAGAEAVYCAAVAQAPPRS